MRFISGQRSYALVAVALALSLLVVGRVGLAQEDSAGVSVEFVGTIEALSENSLTVNQQEILLDLAQLDTALVLGIGVMVEGNLMADGSILASDISPADETNILPGELRLTGALEAASDTTIDVGGNLIGTGGAALEGALASDAIVRVFANTTADGTLQARQIQILDAAAGVDANVNANAEANVSAQTDVNTMLDFNALAEGSFEIVGTLEAVNETEGTITLSGQAINTANADIADDLVLGALVSALVTGDVGASVESGELSATLVANADVTGDASLSLDDDAAVGADAQAGVEAGAGVTTESGDLEAGVDASADVGANAQAGVESDVADTGASLDANVNAGVNTGLSAGDGDEADDAGASANVDAGVNLGADVSVGEDADNDDEGILDIEINLGGGLGIGG